MKTKQVKPCGILFVGDREYYLLHPTPLVADTFPQGGWVRFLVSPMDYTDTYERHLIVSAPWIIEYRKMDEITIEVLEDKLDEFEMVMEDLNV